MRDIKFRAWDVEHKEFNPTVAANILLQIHEPSEDVDPEYGKRFFISQYTGINDINGVPIFEGDIIEATERRYFFGHDKGLQTIKFRSPVVWEDGCFTYSTQQENDSPLCNNEGIVVIGNIYQHPELIKKAG